TLCRSPVRQKAKRRKGTFAYPLHLAMPTPAVQRAECQETPRGGKSRPMARRPGIDDGQHSDVLSGIKQLLGDFESDLAGSAQAHQGIRPMRTDLTDDLHIPSRQIVKIT